MILRFFRDKNGDRVSWDDSLPVRQRQAGCEAMFEYASRWDGIFISDKEIAGWHPGNIGSDYFYGKFLDIGSIVSGWLNSEVCAVVGFHCKGKVWWRTGNEAYRFTKEDYYAYLNTKDKDAKAAILAKYPAPVIVAEAKKPKRKKELAVPVVVDEPIPY